MGKGKRATVINHSQPPLSSTDVLSKPSSTLTDSVFLDGPSLYNSDSASLLQDEEQLLDSAPLMTLVTTYISYFILIVFGHIQDLLCSVFNPDSFQHLRSRTDMLLLTRGSIPSTTAGFIFTGETREVLNLSSYNYLGFAQSDGPCADAVQVAIKKHGLTACSPRLEAGSSELHNQVEALVAQFLGQEDAIVFSMGFATNSTCLPSLVGKVSGLQSCLVNFKLTGWFIGYFFKHNDPKDLESVLRDAISQGQPRTHRPWKKIVVIIEGLYSMEGSICNLPAVIELKHRYKFYLYMDEAHSIGALGPNGRGVCDYYGIDPLEIDVCMGTFTKSFGASGGYIAGSKSIIDHLRITSHSAVYAESMPIPVLQQVSTSMRIIMGEIGGDEGRHRIQTLARNARYFASELRKMGFIVYGRDSQ
ncbi:hypothetical protein BSLG_001506 [Batrachochytrium salamandrivorans]|nr:hypothetical protein BSLG_001506 [Batrachochytrium salamandrivorans]